MKRSNLTIVFLLGFLVVPAAHAQESSGASTNPNYVAGEYRIFTGAGDVASLDDIVEAMGRHEVVFVGETHDDPTGHAIELELFRRANETYGAALDGGEPRTVAVSLEFFQRDVQPILDEYLAGLITEKRFRTDSRPWPGYETDYRPIVEYAKKEGLSVIAANAPTRYTNRATRLGRSALAELSDDAKATLAPLPYGKASRAYLDKFVQVMTAVRAQEGMKCGVPIADPPSSEGGAQHQSPSAHGASGSSFDGQVLWDATMAYWVSDHLVRNPDALVLHMVGSFHVSRGTGTPEHLLLYRPGTSSMIIMMRPVDDISTFEPAPAGQWADFVIQTDGSRTLEALECQAP